MDEVYVMCPAKINLFLNIVGKADDMHLLKMVNQTVNLYDYLTIRPNETGALTFQCTNQDIPYDDTNSCLNAATMMLAYYNIDCGLDIILTKNIPIGAGLGGESTDAAGVILGIKELFNLEIDRKALISLGKQIGADVPFCLLGGSCLVKGIGDHLTKVRMNNYHYLIIHPNFGISTAQAFYAFDKSCAEYRELDGFVLGHNDFEIIAPDQIQDIKDYFADTGAFFTNMTGSGSSVIGAYTNAKKRLAALRGLKKVFQDYQGFSVEPCSGVDVIKKSRLS